MDNFKSLGIEVRPYTEKPKMCFEMRKITIHSQDKCQAEKEKLVAEIKELKALIDKMNCYFQ